MEITLFDFFLFFLSLYIAFKLCFKVETKQQNSNKADSEQGEESIAEKQHIFLIEYHNEQYFAYDSNKFNKFVTQAKTLEELIDKLLKTYNVFLTSYNDDKIRDAVLNILNKEGIKYYEPTIK